MGIRVWGLGLGLGFRVWGLGIQVRGLGSDVWFRVWGCGLRVSGQEDMAGEDGQIRQDIKGYVDVVLMSCQCLGFRV